MVDIENVKQKVFVLLKNDNSGHGIDHIERVYELALKFTKIEKANIEIVSLVALLHDVDDYKLFGTENSKNLQNATRIMVECDIESNIQELVLDAIKTIGFSNRLRGICPKTLEAKIVSDADMCDALGLNGIMRTAQYSWKNNVKFFDKNIFPIEDIDADKYTRKTADTGICHIFEKVLKLRKMIMTKAGQIEAQKKFKVTIEFLCNYFEEQNAFEWIEYLNKTLNKNT